MESLLARLAQEPCFREGFAFGLLAGLMVGAISQAILYFWNRLLQLFEPSKTPATPNTGPSAWDNFLRVVGYLVVIGLILGSCILLALSRREGFV